MSYLDELKHVAGMAITDLGTLALANAKEFPEASKELARIAMNLSRVVDRRPPSEPQGEAVAWQVRRADGSPLATWENCTKECHDETVRTGRYLGFDNGPRSEARALYTRPQPGETPTVDLGATGMLFGATVTGAVTIKAERSDQLHGCVFIGRRQEPHPGEGGGQVTDEMVERALMADLPSGGKVCDYMRTPNHDSLDDVMRAAITAALSKGGQGGWE